MLKQAVHETRTSFLVVGIVIFFLLALGSIGMIYEELTQEQVMLTTVSGQVFDLTGEHFFINENGEKMPLSELDHPRYGKLTYKKAPNYWHIGGLSVNVYLFMWLEIQTLAELRRRKKASTNQQAK